VALTSSYGPSAAQGHLPTCLVVLYGHQASKIAALRTTEVSCSGGGTQLKLGADWLDVPEPIVALLRQHYATATARPRRRTQPGRGRFPGSSPLNIAATVGSFAFHQLGIPAGRRAGASWSAKHAGDPRRRAGRLAGHSDAPRFPRLRPTGLPTPPAKVLPPRTTGRGRTLLPVPGICARPAPGTARRGSAWAGVISRRKEQQWPRSPAAPGGAATAAPSCASSMSAKSVRPADDLACWVEQRPVPHPPAVPWRRSPLAALPGDAERIRLVPGPARAALAADAFWRRSAGVSGWGQRK
jgi:hypothetical protein